LELTRWLDVEKDGARTVEGYNRDDCLSTWEMRNWLETNDDRHLRHG
jgi:predicted RecB family nuclease